MEFFCRFEEKKMFIENIFEFNPESFRINYLLSGIIIITWFWKENAHRHIYSSAHIEISKQWCITSWHTATVRYIIIGYCDCMSAVRMHVYVCTVAGCVFWCVVNGISFVNVWTYTQLLRQQDRINARTQAWVIKYNDFISNFYFIVIFLKTKFNNAIEFKCLLTYYLVFNFVFLDIVYFYF